MTYSRARSHLLVLVPLEEPADHPRVSLFSRVVKRGVSALVHGVAVITLVAKPA